MIVGERKPLAEIAEMQTLPKDLSFRLRHLCVTVCLAGGEKEAEETAAGSFFIGSKGR